MKDLSIIIVNYKGGEKLVQCLKSLEAIEDIRFSFEVIVVDNQSDDGSLAGLILRFPRFVFLSNTGNNGFSNGCNLGASKSEGEYLLFLNPDTRSGADALSDMLAEIRSRPAYSIVSCSQIRENGSKERPYGQFPTVFTLTGWLRLIHRLFTGRMENTVRRAGKYLYPDWVSGSVVM
ncbi:MAG TPA: glycosyltransferase, partial [Prolixibacteraceae bacterium]|nr:glycosyltransferase [Prolixibacteraceae bacterium]